MAGKGSIEKRGKDTWRLVVSAGMKDDKQIKKNKTVTTAVSCPEKSCRSCVKITRCKARREAEKLLAEFTVEVEKGLFIEPTKLTFKEFTERWLRDYAEKNLAPKTLFRYKQILDSRVFPAMGHIKIEKIAPVHLIEFYANLQEDGIREDGKPGALSESTILYHHRIISSIMQDAVQWQVIQSNPASRVKPPRVKRKAAAFYDEEQTAALLLATENEPLQYRVIIVLAIATGLRRGELMGLEWQDVNFNDNTVTVRQASQYVPGKGSFLKEPKNETSKRTISVPASVMAMLKQYRAHQAAEQLKVGDLWQGTGVLSNFNELFNTVSSKDLSGAQLIKTLRSQSETVEKWEETIQKIADRVNNEEFIQEFRKLGAKAAPEIAALNTLSDKQLQEYISLWQTKNKNPKGGRLFTTWDGQPMHPDTISKWFPKFLARTTIHKPCNKVIGEKAHCPHCGRKVKDEDIIKLPPLPFHGLRHTSATLSIAQGAPLKNVSSRLGHADVGTTGNIYAHALKSVDRDIAEKMDHIFNGEKAQNK